MTRQTLADAFDNAATALAQLASELRNEQPSSGVSPVPAGSVAGAVPPAAPAAQPYDELPPPARLPARPADESAFTECPAHRKPWMDGRYGKFCPAASEDPDWSNAKGYCSVTPRSAAAWLRKHPRAVA